MANTVIQLKFSTATNKPPLLNIGEPAYSYTSNTLFIGTSDGLSTLNIGGYHYTSQIDDATDANTASKLVKRDASGGFNATYVRASLFGNANTATALETARNFSIDGSDVDSSTVSFDGTGAVVLQGNLKTTGVSSGTYGGSANVPVFTVDSKGRLSYAANVAITTSFDIAGDAGTGTVAGGETLTFVGRQGIETIAVDANNSILIDVDNTVVRTTGNQTITGDVSITGNLVVSGNTITVDSEVLRVNDSIILLANNNIGDTVDIGFAAHYGPTSDEHTGLVRHAADGKWYLFENYDDHFIHGTNTINIADPSFVTSNLVANLEAPTEVLIKNFNILDRTNSAFTLANTNATLAQNAYNQANTATTIATGAFHQANAGFDKANTATNTAQAAFDLANGTAGIANTDVTNISITGGSFGQVTGGYAFIPAFTVAANGRISQANSTLLAVDTTAITSGFFTVERGGTGANTFTTNGVLLGQGTSAFTTASSSTEGHVLTINASGIPTFAFLQGGTF
jgi:hypothetical protein